MSLWRYSVDTLIRLSLTLPFSCGVSYRHVHAIALPLLTRVLLLRAQRWPQNAIPISTSAASWLSKGD